MDSHDLIEVRGASENNLKGIGPGAGHDGGEIVFTGTPAELVATGDSLAAEHLRGYVGGRRRPARKGGGSKRKALA